MSGGPASGHVGRRELIGALARWSVPTVVTLSLGARALHAASCPPCTKRTGGTCKSCSTSQILNCQCEPCLGPPYCTSAGPAAPAFSGGGPSGGQAAPGAQGAAGGQDGSRVPGLPGGMLGGAGGDQRIGGGAAGGGLRGPTSGSPMAPLYQPFATQPRYRPLGGGLYDNGGLYGRLRGDTINSRRRP